MRAVVLMCLLSSAHSGWYKPGHKPAEPKAGEECSMDPYSCGCCVMQREVNRLKTYFNMSLQKLEMEYLQTEQSLKSINGSRSAFSAAVYNRSINCFGPFQSDMNIIYNYVFLNLGDDYNEMSGIYTVPQPGVYILIVTIYNDAGSAGTSLTACGSLQVNNKAVVYTKEKQMHDSEDSATTVVALHLESGDQVSVIWPQGCSFCSSEGFYNTFTAFLLYST